MQNKIITYCTAALSTALLAIPAFGQQHPASPDDKAPLIPLDPAVRTGKLANGFTYYIRHNEEPQHRVVMYLANKVGSILEEDDQRGLAHFMEHMNFNGTTHFPKNQLVNYLQKAGVRFGADLNAYTSFDETVFQLPLPADSMETLAGGFQVMHDWAQAATLETSEIDAERGVVLEEKRLGKGANERMSRLYFPMLLNHSRYADRLPIGTDTVLLHFNPGTLRRFHHDWYRPDLQALIIVGDIDVNKTEKTIKDLFSDLKNPVPEKPRPAYSIRLKDQNQYLVVTDKEQPYTQAALYFKRKAEILRTPADYTSYLGQTVIIRALRERLIEIGQRDNPPFISAGVGNTDFPGGIEAFSLSVTTRPGQLQQGIVTAYREIQRARRFGITATEVERAKKFLLNTLESAAHEQNKIASDQLVKQYLANFLKEQAAPDAAYEYRLAQQVMGEIDVTAINKEMQRLTEPVNRDVLIMAPEKEKDSLPTQQEFERWLKQTSRENLSPYKDDISKLPLLKQTPQPGKIIGRKEDARLGVIIYQLSNGIEVYVKPTDYKNDEVNMQAYALGGYSRCPDSLFYSSRATGMEMEFGAGNYTPGQLRKYNADKKLGLIVTIDERTQHLAGQSTNKDMEAMLEEMFAYMTEPRKDTAVFHASIAKRKAALTNLENSPASVFQDTILAVMGNHDPRRMRETVADINKIRLDQLYDVYRDRMADASGFKFLFVGSIDTLTLKPLLEKYVAGLPALYRHETYNDLGYHPPYENISRIVRKGIEPQAKVFLNFTGPFPNNYTNNFKLEALRQVLLIRLIERLREEEGGVYTPQVLAGAGKLYGEYYNAQISFGCAPENVDKLVAATLDEIDKIKKGQIDSVNLEKFKVTALRSQEVNEQSNSYWQTYLQARLQNNENLDEVLQYRAAINAVTLQDIQEMAIKYLDEKRFIKIILLPENKAPAKSNN